VEVIDISGIMVSTGPRSAVFKQKFSKSVALADIHPKGLDILTRVAWVVNSFMGGTAYREMQTLSG
jgi:hypothetical protein